MTPDSSISITPEAKDVLKLVDRSSLEQVVDNIQVTSNQEISKDDVLDAIRRTGSNVRELMQLFSPIMRVMIRIESAPQNGRSRRNVEDIISGIRDCAFSYGLARQALGS